MLYHYDEAGRLTTVMDARAGLWRYVYAGNLLTEVHAPLQPDQAMIRNEYATDGRMTRQLDTMGNATAFAWDAEAQVATTTDADGVIVRDGYRDNVLLYTRRGAGEEDGAVRLGQHAPGGLL